MQDKLKVDVSSSADIGWTFEANQLDISVEVVAVFSANSFGRLCCSEVLLVAIFL